MVQTSSSQLPDKWPRPGGNGPKGGIAITCTVCEATFTYSPAAQDLQLTADTLEAVFMSVCHFCFRCRRLACPECWDALHGLCGACVEEASLPFRAAAAPLHAGSSSSIQRADTPPPANPSSSALMCVRPGHFQGAAAPASAEPSSLPAEAARASTPPDRQVVNKRDDRPHRPIFYIPVVPLDAQRQEAEQEQAAAGPFVRIVQVVEQLVTAIAFSILIIIVVLIVLAELSSPANAQINHLLHIDIRGEIAYLSYLVRQVHL